MRKTYLKSALYILGALLNFFCYSQTNEPPVIFAEGNQLYCSGSPINITTDFNITDPDDTAIESIVIQISSGYVQGEDTIEYTGALANITQLWDATTGKLKLYDTTGNDVPYSSLIAAVKTVVYNSNNPNASGVKEFSITIGDANYLASTGHFYQYTEDIGVSWFTARYGASIQTYYGLQGYLATLTSAEEAEISRDQAIGAGWIGASDSQKEGEWKWVTGPEAGTVFWRGYGVDNGGGPVNGEYSFWNEENPQGADEPNNSGGVEHYAHITDSSIGKGPFLGSWNDLSMTGATSGPYQPKGYIVEFGGLPGDPELNLIGTTKITIPEITTTTPDSRCGAGTVTLEATANTNLVEIQWFDAASGGTLLFTGTTYEPSLTATKNFYVAASVGHNCSTTKPRIEVQAVINNTPVVTISDVTICSESSVDLEAISSSPTAVVDWYDQATGGTLLTTGLNYTTPILSASTTYYIETSESSCMTARIPVSVELLALKEPTGNTVQEFCSTENATIADLAASGMGIQWYDSMTGGNLLPTTNALTHNASYFASQSENGCESVDRFEVTAHIYDVLVPPASITPIEVCDNNSIESGNDGFVEFNLRDRLPEILNGQSPTDYTVKFFTDNAYTKLIPAANETAFTNTVQGGQTIYVRVTNTLNTTCYTDMYFKVIDHSIYNINATYTYYGCDEDGVLDGYTDFNLGEVNNLITTDTNLTITYYLTQIDAEQGNNPIQVQSSFNNKDSTDNLVYARIENTSGCYGISTINLNISTTAIPSNYVYEFTECDDNLDGFYTFNLSDATTDILRLFPVGQNLSVRYFKDANAQEEIDPSIAFTNNNPYFQTIYVRVETQDNNECFSLGPHVILTVHEKPVFDIDEIKLICQDVSSITLEPSNPKGLYTYEWFDANGNSISTDQTIEVSDTADFSVIATSTDGNSCTSRQKTIKVRKSVAPTLTLDDITVIDFSTNNQITIDTTTIGSGEYEFALDQETIFQSNPYFDHVTTGLHNLFVRDINKCGTLELEIYILGFPPFFTPNGDGFNDIWKFKDSEDYFISSLIYIYDRYGKLLTVTNAVKGWDGTYNGAKLPTENYWFTAELVEKDGNIIMKKGHFVIKR